jgi:hypothetical protein
VLGGLALEHDIGDSFLKEQLSKHEPRGPSADDYNLSL